jgi:hypothetical protein
MKKFTYLLFSVAASLLVTVASAFAADGYWVFERYGEQIPAPKSQGKACTVTGVAKMNGAKMDIACTDIKNKPYSHHGHFSWQFSNLDGTLLPGEKINFKGTVTNTGGRDALWQGSIKQGTTHPASGNLSIMGTDGKKAGKAGMSASAEGTWTVPSGPPRPMPDGKPASMVLTFQLGSGGGVSVSKYIFYAWRSGKPAPGTESKTLPPDPAGVIGPPVMVQAPAQAGPQASTPPAATPPAAKPEAKPAAQPAAKPGTPVFETFNAGGVGNSPTVPATFTVKGPYVITQIMTYHWNNGKGMAPGTLALKDQSGKVYGPWPAKGTPGSGVANSFWTVNPNIRIPAGTYTVIDSSPATWSMNAASGNRGFVQVLGHSTN